MRSAFYSHTLMLMFIQLCVTAQLSTFFLRKKLLDFLLKKTLLLTLGLILLAHLMKFFWKFSAENDVVETGYGRYKVKKVKHRKKSFKGLMLISYKVCIWELRSNVPPVSDLK